MKTAGYIFLAILLAVLLYVSVERFTVTVTGADAATPPMMMGGPMSMQGPMGGPMPTSAMSTTSTFAAPVDLSKPPPSLAPPLPEALQPIPPTPPTAVAPPEATSRLDELTRQELAAQDEYNAAFRAERAAYNVYLSRFPTGGGAGSEELTAYNAAYTREMESEKNLERIRNELAALRR